MSAVPRAGPGAIARALADLGYDGTVAMEAWAAEDSDLALERFRSALAWPGAGSNRK